MTSRPREHPLYASFSKLARAQQRLDEFEATIPVHGATASWRIHRIPVGNRLVHVVVKLDDPLPDEMHHSAAEATYHVRSALDQMLVSIAQHHGVNDVGSIHFPFMSSENDFATKGTTNKIGKLPKDVQDLIFQSAPWKNGGDLALWGLGQLANIDKHRALIPFGSFGGPTGMQNVTVNGGGHPDSIGVISAPGDLVEGVVISKIGENGSFRFREGGALTLSAKIVFGADVPVFAHQEAAPVIKNLIELGNGIVETFSTHCFGE